MNLNFAENCKRLRKEKGITQEKIADILGVSAQSISRWELLSRYRNAAIHRQLFWCDGRLSFIKR